MTPVMQRIMDEHIVLPGCPQIVVRRGWACQWLKNAGMDVSARGFGSLDYMVFAAPRVDESLTEMEPWVVRFLDEVQGEMRKEYAA